MRIPHYIKRNDTTELPSQFIFVDTETKGEDLGNGREKHTLDFGWACYVRIRTDKGKTRTVEDWHRFTTTDSFWEWALRRCRLGAKTYIFAHNWNFDGAILKTSTTLKDEGFKTMQYINEKPPFILRVRRGKQYIALIDSLNYFGMSLAALGDSIGIDKLPFPSESDSQETWDTYCRRDVEVIRDAILAFRDFIATNDLGSFRPTLASQAYAAYRHRFMPTHILIHDDESVMKLERQSYYGGRVECYHIGKLNKPLYYLDINSLYPFVMSENRYPTILQFSTRDASVEDVTEWLERYSLTAEVTLETTETAFPYRFRNKLVFPTGIFRTTLSTPELKYALSIGAIKKVHRVAAYTDAFLFGDYVDTLYGLRRKYKEAGNLAFNFLCKIMMNSLYGKFGQRGAHWEEVRPAVPSDPPEWLQQDTDESPVIQFRVRLGKVQQRNRDKEATESFPAIAAHVTAFARIHMYQLMKQAGSGHVYYTDTDSLIVDRWGYAQLREHRDDAKLGYLKLEDRAKTATFYGPKDYRFGKQQRTKGIRANAKQIAEASWEQVRFWSWDVHLQKTEDGFIFIDTVEKTLKRLYDKGKVLDSGEVEPLTLG